MSTLKRKSYTSIEKWRIIKWYEENHASMDKVALQFNINKGQFSRWYANRNQIRDAPSQARSVGSGRKAAYPEMENHVASITPTDIDSSQMPNESIDSHLLTLLADVRLSHDEMMFY